MISLENKYFAERSRALRMGVDFTIPFDDWLKIWQDSGKFDQRGGKKGQYVLSRIDNTKPYEIGNIIINQVT